MEKENKVFCCKGKRLANFLIKNGSKLVRVDKDQKAKGFLVFLFVNDETIESNLEKWREERKRCLF